MTVDDKIFYHRKRLGLTQKQLANYLKCSVQMIRRYESGRMFPNLHRSILLSKLFNIPIEELDSQGGDEL